MIDLKAICLSAVMLVATGSAAASPNGGGTYGGFGYGSSQLETDDGSVNFEDTNIRAYLGYQLSRHFAIEGGLSLVPLEDVMGDVADLTGMDVSVLAILPVTSKLSAYARLGYWDWEVSAPYNGTYYDLFGGTDMLYGIGLEYKVSSRFKLRLDATRLEASDAEVDTLNGSVAFSW